MDILIYYYTYNILHNQLYISHIILKAFQLIFCLWLKYVSSIWIVLVYSYYCRILCYYTNILKYIYSPEDPQICYFQIFFITKNSTIKIVEHVSWHKCEYFSVYIQNGNAETNLKSIFWLTECWLQAAFYRGFTNL